MFFLNFFIFFQTFVGEGEGGQTLVWNFPYFFLTGSLRSILYCLILRCQSIYPPCFFSYHCAIEDGKEVVLTGGYDHTSTGESYTLSTVTRYNMQGQATPLPSLNTKRFSHACGSIKKSDGAMVSSDIMKNI